jgi:hypothetical protein
VRALRGACIRSFGARDDPQPQARPPAVIHPPAPPNPGKQRHMAITSEAIVESLLTSIETSQRNETPYKHWFLSRCLPEDTLDAVLALPFEAPPLDGISGKRELHNNTRRYFDAENMGRFPVCKAFNDAFQSRAVTKRIEEHFGTNLDGSYLRVELAQDTDGFWLEPHTDLGVKLFTMLLYTSKDKSHADLGTDIYDAEKKHIARSPFESNGALVFVPSNITYHGFEPRKINGVRKSVIINYVTNEWRAREQLAFPDAPIEH